ncbi:MAG: hypothetical protein SNJ82_07535 [Gemmataceae bacterium]
MNVVPLATAALLGACAAGSLLAVLHRGLNVPETPPATAVLLYGAMTLLGALLALLTAWLTQPPVGEVRPRHLIVHNAGVGLRNGLLIGAAYSLFRLLVHFAGQEWPLGLLAMYAAGVTVFFGLGLSGVAAVLAYWQTRGLK